ncbi:MAG TPA: Fe-S cluster assembly protein IscX [Aggregatilineales bacterium]|nr:Fe-S cluster assembly protein IscX [Aggregatilineales bacterium]
MDDSEFLRDNCDDNHSQPGHKLLYWDASYEIVLALIEAHPDITDRDLDDVSLNRLLEWIIALPGFADEVILANDEILSGILREWFEEITSYE